MFSSLCPMFHTLCNCSILMLEFLSNISIIPIEAVSFSLSGFLIFKLLSYHSHASISWFQSMKECLIIALGKHIIFVKFLELFRQVLSGSIYIMLICYSVFSAYCQPAYEVTIKVTLLFGKGNSRIWDFMEFIQDNT